MAKKKTVAAKAKKAPAKAKAKKAPAKAKAKSGNVVIPETGESVSEDQIPPFVLLNLKNKNNG